MRKTRINLTFLISWLVGLSACQAPQSGDQLQTPDELQDKIGQMLLIGLRGTELTPDNPIVGSIRNQKIGGIILFDYDVVLKKSGRNISNAAQVKKLLADLQSYSSIPLFTAIDQEGGKVNRLKPAYGFPPSVSAQYLGNLDHLDSTTYHATQTARLLKELGFNLNFAPVLDVNTNPTNPVIGKVERSFSANPKSVAAHGLATIQAHHQENILTAVKHFPGHGSAYNDSHLGMVDVSDSWKEEELFPFQIVIAEGMADMVMTAHIFNRHLDAQLPATLSTPIIDGLLRKKMGFQGVVVSDDMQMKAISGHYGLENALEAALLAGVDVFIFGNNLVYEPDIAQRAIQIIEGLVKQGKISPERIEESYQRILALKRKNGLLK